MVFENKKNVGLEKTSRKSISKTLKDNVYSLIKQKIQSIKEVWSKIGRLLDKLNNQAV